jgi:uncharacterized protein YdeI (YjbR/CyaY-like superfamily)
VPDHPDTYTDGLPILQFDDAAAWDRWLHDNHATSRGVWLRQAKKDAPVTTPSHPEALDVALCHGWIDGQRRALDQHFYLQRFTPRRPGSRWSKINTERAEWLIEQGRMTPAGLREVEQARQDGRWETAYEPQSRAEPPPDLAQALDAHPDAKRFFGTLTGARRYAFLYRLQNVKRPEARANRIAQYIELLESGRTLDDR